MPVWIRSHIKFLIALCLVISFCFIEGAAQTRRKKRVRRSTKPVAARPVITNPPVAPPTPAESATPSGDDVKIISTADATQEPTQTGQPKKAKTPATSDPEEMQQTIT